MNKITVLPSLLVSTTCALGLITSTIRAQLSGTLTNGLVSYYTFDGNANDVAGTNNATAVGVVLTNGVTGAANTAYYFSNGSPYLTAPFTPPTNNSFTWSLWINPTTLKETYFYMAGEINLNGGGKSFFMRPTGQVGFSTYDDALSGEENALINALESSAPIESNVWTHIAITSNTNNLRTLYVNGVAVTEKTSSGYGQLGVANFIFGADRFLRDNLSLQGRMDDVAIYDRALSAAEVSQLYRIQRGPIPVIELSGANPLQIFKGEAFTDPGALVTDDVDETRNINGSGTIDTSTVGTYTLTYEATDADGNNAQSVTRTVNVVLNPAGDEDGDGVTNYREHKDGTNPNDPTSFNTLSKGLVAYYPFNGNASDESGYSRHIQTQTGNLDFAEDRFCSEGGALALTKSFSASSTTYFEATAPRTFSQWVKVVEFPARTDPGWFKQDVPIAAFPQSVVLGNIFASDGEWWLDTGWGVAFYDFPLTTSWTQITVVYEGNVADGKVFRNGVEVPMKSWVFTKTQFDTGNYNALRSVTDIWNYTNTSASNLIDEVRVYDRALSPSEVKSLFYETAFTDDERSFLTASPAAIGHYSKTEYDASRSSGQTDVINNPSAFSLFTQQQYNDNRIAGRLDVTTDPASYSLYTWDQFANNRIAGRSDVLSSPMSYGLYTSNSIMDLRMGGLMIQKQGTNAVVSFQPQTTTDLTKPFTNNGTPITNTIPMPGNKGFIRINAKP